MKRLISAIYPEKSPFEFIFDEQIHTRDVKELEQSDVKALILWGGEDISPSIYGHEPSSLTGAEREPSLRDQIEIKLARRAIELDIPIIGVCRGAQLMCALSGGTLIQHVNNHAGASHPIITNEGHNLYTNSVHHQMLNPFKVDHELLAWCPKKLSTVYMGANDSRVLEAYDENFKEPEIVWFPQTKSLCIQGHPEYGTASVPFIRYCLRLVEERILSD